ncbi:MAG: YceI family protein [Reyranella sp.]|uniref:YceI family protein n=1 Tax=Reyranella sp. TaxID=1929291 RepID=UPI001ACE155B|nr:YceI family protein [Reyranella sp.]MBN9089263.1 YceI family protein [Reyranella sp.]
MPGAEGRADGYAGVAKLLHWLTALLVLGLIGVGLWMVDLPIGLPKLYAFAWHKWIGLTVLVLTVLRLAWRAYSPPPPLPPTVTAWERAVAPWSHGLLLVLLVALPISGWLMSSAGGVKVIWFGYLELPDLLERDTGLFERLVTWHHWLAWTLMAVLALHLLAVLRHDVLRRDGIFRRMWPLALLLAIVVANRPVLAQSGWTIDHVRSRIAFSVEQVGKVASGRIGTWTGTIVFDPNDLAAARFDIRMDMRTASTGAKDVDDMMRSASFLDTANQPEAHFVSTAVASRGGDTYEARGKLTIRGVARDVVLPFTLRLQGNQATARGTLPIKRLDYGVGRNEWASTNYVADVVNIEVAVVASRP